ncbi:condensation domain-containing protein [Paracoccus laeviglucosivorans]|uniref:Enterobactin synthetase component F n=1 Tax=Paracoccus laeviglucosivorans TaxID=1197861 RepID=A0A521DQV2_9RHOB|nr:condensation domain-containing protein [Paracoccus laeviglucosivorans]SMO74084.1 enterobactin synthetase component F [Paracoccus laeviglucosivorans]
MTKYQRAEYKLTLAQLDFWEEFRLHPGEAVSTVAHAVELRGAVDADALARAITQVVAETDVLSLRFTEGDEGPRQQLDPTRRPELRHLDFSVRPDPMADAMAMMQADVEAPLDLVNQPLSQQWLIRLGADRFVWYNRGHHIVLDGYAMGLMETRCAQLYAAHRDGLPTGEPLTSFFAYLTEEGDYRASPRHAKDGQHWTDILSAPPAPKVLQKGSEDYPASPMCHEESLVDLRPSLLARASELGIGWPDLLTALCSAWAALELRDHSAARVQDSAGRVTMPIWLPYMSRMGSVAIRIPALVVNILPFDASVAATESVAQTVTQLAGRLRKLRRHGRYRIEQIGFDYGLGASQRFFFSPLINVLPFEPARFDGTETQRHVLSNGPGDGFNITIRGDGEANGLDLCLEADPVLTPPADFTRHAVTLPAFLRAALALDAGERPIGALLTQPETV